MRTGSPCAHVRTTRKIWNSAFDSAPGGRSGVQTSDRWIRIGNRFDRQTQLDSLMTAADRHCLVREWGLRRRPSIE